MLGLFVFTMAGRWPVLLGKVKSSKKSPFQLIEDQEEFFSISSWFTRKNL